MKQSGRLFQPEPRNSKENLFSQVIVGTKHIHSNDFHLTTNGSIVSKKATSDDRLYSSLKNSDDSDLFKILRNEAHLSLSKSVLIPRHSLWKTRKIILKTEVIELANES